MADEKKKETKLDPLATGYLFVDYEKCNGVRDGLYRFINYNEFSKPTEDLDVATSSVTVTMTGFPDPITGKRILLPNGSTTNAALSWAASGEQDNGLVRNTSSDYGWYQSATQIWRVTDSGFFLPQATATRVAFFGASGLVSDDAGFTYVAADDQVTLSQSHATTTPFLIGAQASTGDAAWRVALGSSRSFALGIDNSDSDSFKISTAASASAVLGTGDLVTILTGGNVGINTTGPDRKLDVLDASNPQIRLTKTDGSDYVDLQANAGFTLSVNGTGFMTVSTVGDWAGSASRSGADHEFLWKNSNATASSNSYIIIEQDAGYGAVQFLDSSSGSRWSLGQDSVTVAAGSLFRLAYYDGLGSNVLWETNSDGETVIYDLAADRDAAFFKLAGNGNSFGTATERYSVEIDLSSNRAWPGTGSPTIATQRDIVIQAPVYVLGSGTAVTFTDTAVMYFAGPASGGAGITITNPWVIWVDSGACRFDGKTFHGGEVEIDGALNHDGSTVGFYGVTPVSRPSAYSISNGTTDRTYDANSTSTDELADVLYTLITDLINVGLLQ